MARSATGKDRLTAAEKRRLALELRRTGLSYERIAQQIGISRAAAYKHVRKALDDIIEQTHEDAEHVRTLELERLDRLLLGLWRRASEGDIHAVDKALKVMERRARMLGLDAPARRELSGPGGGPIQTEGTGLAALLEEARAVREQGGDTGEEAGAGGD